MKIQDENILIREVTAENVTEEGIYCIRDKKSPGYRAKVEWFRSKVNSGLRIKIATDLRNRPLGFIEYIPSEQAWRPVQAANYLFIQCIAVFVKEAKKSLVGTTLIGECEKDALKENRSGICVMTSDGPWIANRTLFRKNGFSIAATLDRFELMVKSFNDQGVPPTFNDWTRQLGKYKGWHLVYSDQCPWHEKSVTDLKQAAMDQGIELHIKKLTTPGEAQKAPSGFGTFSLIRDGRLLGDHYLSRTRFENILKKENC